MHFYRNQPNICVNKEKRGKKEHEILSVETHKILQCDATLKNAGEYFFPK